MAEPSEKAPAEDPPEAKRYFRGARVALKGTARVTRRDLGGSSKGTFKGTKGSKGFLYGFLLKGTIRVTTRDL